MSDAIIIGAGPGGIVQALALRSAGIACTVYDREDKLDAGQGHYISLGTNGLYALQAVDVVPSGIPIPRLLPYSGSGLRLGELYNGPSDRSAPPSILVERHAFRRELYEIAAERGVRFEHGKELASCTDTGSGVTAVFTDATTTEGDFLIGADGVHSATRRALFPQVPQARYTGMLGVGGRAYSSALRPTPEAVVCLFGWEAFFSYHVVDNGEIYWMAFFPEPTQSGLDGALVASDAQWRDRLLSLFWRDMSAVREVIANTCGLVDVYPEFDVRGLSSWHRGRVALIGDAARTAAPRVGVGASLAMEDAVVVAKFLRDMGDPAQAFAAYQARRAARVRRVISWSRIARPPKVRNALGMRMREIGMPLMFRCLPSIASMDWLYGHRVSLAEPARAVPAGP